jgi:hypothetical protein
MIAPTALLTYKEAIMNFRLMLIIIIVISLLNLGCTCASHMRLTYHTDRPVMLGKVRKIGGASKQLGVKKNAFDISHYNGEWMLLHGPGQGFHDSVDADGELKKIVDAPHNLIKIDTVYFGSVLIIFMPILPIFGSNHSTTGIQGGVYEEISVEQIENSVRSMSASGEKP